MFPAAWSTRTREVKEELGLDKDAIRLLCVEYRRTSAGHDHVNFVFDGGVLTDDEIANIKLQEAELTEYRFVSPDEGMALLSEGWGTRMIESLKARAAHTIVYLENGKEMGKSSQ
jgi:8-oxo-dGTP pyrophosphatase MutT (NUDIX family)